MDKKAKMKSGTKFILWLVIIYLGLGAIYHLTTNPNGQWVSDLLMGGYYQLKIWFHF